MYIRRVVGKSMEPNFKESDLVLFIPAKQYRKGNVVIAHIDGKEVIKRVSNNTGNTYVLLGDNPNASTDSRTFGPVKSGQIKGRLVIHLPMPKFFAKQP